MRTKDFRRSKNQSKLKRRVERYAAINWMGEKSREDFRKKVLKGEYCNWIRTTGTPCSCEMCSGIYKYKRISKSEFCKLILQQMPS